MTAQPSQNHFAIDDFLHRQEQKGLLRGKTLAIDATTLEANAAMKSTSKVISAITRLSSRKRPRFRQTSLTAT